jgi:hypothetical protein
MRIARATELCDRCAWAANSTVLGAEATKVVVARYDAVDVSVCAVRRAAARIEEYAEFMASCKGDQHIDIAGA